jgi:hypothetical protein
MVAAPTGATRVRTVMIVHLMLNAHVWYRCHDGDADNNDQDIEHQRHRSRESHVDAFSAAHRDFGKWREHGCLTQAGEDRCTDGDAEGTPKTMIETTKTPARIKTVSAIPKPSLAEQDIPADHRQKTTV